MPTALITGITGQDGAYLSKLLLGKGYRVCGTSPAPAGAANKGALREMGVVDDVNLLRMNLTDPPSIEAALREVKPDEIYNLAAQSSVARSFEAPLQTAEVCGLGVVNLLEAVRRLCPQSRVFQASSSAIFASSAPGPRDEASALGPDNPYGAAKLYGHTMTSVYRRAYGMFACCGILFNHESPLRGEAFVTRKVTLGVARIKQGQQQSLLLGELEVQRDWGFAGDYVEAMWLMLRQPSPQDYVIATGRLHSLRELVDLAFRHAGLDYRDHVVLDPSLLRPAETYAMVGSAGKAQAHLGWRATVRFEEMIGLMVDADLARVSGMAGSLLPLFPRG